MSKGKSERDLFSPAPPHGDRDGVTFNPAEDRDRLDGQMDAVWRLMRDGNWRSTKEIAEAVGCPDASASARLRDLRKPKFGGWNIERAYVGNGLWRYRVAEKANA